MKSNNPQLKESTHITWWKGLNEEEKYKLCCKHFQGIPVDSLMERSIKVMYHYENPQLPDYLVWWNGLKGSQQNAMIDKYPELFGTKNTENKMEKYMYAAEQKERVMKIFIDKYKDSQMYDGMIPANSSLIDFIGDFDIIASLVMEGKLERRNCEGSAYQLSKEEREKVFSAENPLTTETTTNTVTGEVMKTHNLTMLAAMEFGYRECEKGNNLDMAFINFNKALNNK